VIKGSEETALHKKLLKIDDIFLTLVGLGKSNPPQLSCSLILDRLKPIGLDSSPMLNNLATYSMSTVEYHNIGPGSSVDQRVKWIGHKPILSLLWDL
jgi:hypothetical protein